MQASLLRIDQCGQRGLSGMLMVRGKGRRYESNRKGGVNQSRKQKKKKQGDSTLHFLRAECGWKAKHKASAREHGRLDKAAPAENAEPELSPNSRRRRAPFHCGMECSWRCILRNDSNDPTSPQRQLDRGMLRVSLLVFGFGPRARQIGPLPLSCIKLGVDTDAHRRHRPAACRPAQPQVHRLVDLA